MSANYTTSSTQAGNLNSLSQDLKQQKVCGLDQACQNSFNQVVACYPLIIGPSDTIWETPSQCPEFDALSPLLSNSFKTEATGLSLPQGNSVRFLHHIICITCDKAHMNIRGKSRDYFYEQPWSWRLLGIRSTVMSPFWSYHRPACRCRAEEALRCAVHIKWNKVFSSRMFEEHWSSSVVHWTSSWLDKESDEEEQQLYGPFCSFHAFGMNLLLICTSDLMRLQKSLYTLFSIVITLSRVPISLI